MNFYRDFLEKTKIDPNEKWEKILSCPHTRVRNALMMEECETILDVANFIDGVEAKKIRVRYFGPTSVKQLKDSLTNLFLSNKVNGSLIPREPTDSAIAEMREQLVRLKYLYKSTMEDIQECMLKLAIWACPFKIGDIIEFRDHKNKLTKGWVGVIRPARSEISEYSLIVYKIRKDGSPGKTITSACNLMNSFDGTQVVKIGAFQIDLLPKDILNENRRIMRYAWKVVFEEL